MMNEPKIEMIATGELIPYARNARTHSEAQVAQIAASIREFGFTNPVLVTDDLTIIAGHGRLEAARKLGLDRVPCIRQSQLTPTQVKAYVIADNKLALNAGWDLDLLKVDFLDLQDADFDLGLTGFDPGELASIFLEREEGETDPDAEWEGMPEFADQDPCFRKVIVSFDSEEDVIEFFRVIGQRDTGKTKSIWYPEKERRDLEAMRWVGDE